MDWMERLLNRGSDADWAWWPVLALRPARTGRMGVGLWLTLTLLIFLVLEALFVGGQALRWTLQASGRAHGLDGFVYGLGWYLRRDTARVAALTLAGTLSLGTLFIWAWNRRAERLRREGEAGPATPAPPAGVWPPPPERPAASGGARRWDGRS